MNTAERGPNQQVALWNGDAGRAWVEAQEVLDRLFKPFEDQLVDAVRGKSVRDVLDVGCGTGATTLAIARTLGANGSCAGIDISEPMLAVARTRAAHDGIPASFILGDAQTHTFAPAAYDMIVSRFGVMFFADVVGAFVNLRRAARAGAHLQLIAWRGAADNPFMTAAEHAAASLLPELPARRPDEPGQFAFADREYVERILDQSGWSEIDLQPIDVPLALPVASLDLYYTRLGPVGRIFAQADEQTRAAIIAKVRPAYDRYLHGDEVRFTAACWMIGGRAPAR